VGLGLRVEGTPLAPSTGARPPGNLRESARVCESERERERENTAARPPGNLRERARESVRVCERER